VWGRGEENGGKRMGVVGRIPELLSKKRTDTVLTVKIKSD
jgi:hypothetical protein